MTARIRDAEATRARILRAAVQEFARYGLAGARGERIAQRARSSERMLYYYFGTKEGLYREALESVYVSLRQAERSLDLDGLAPDAALAAFCRFVWRYYLDHPEFISLVSTENLYRARHLRRSPRLGELVSPIAQMLSRMLEAGCRKGVFRDDIDEVELYLAIASLGYFCLSNRHTLSALLGRDVADPDNLEHYWTGALRMVSGYVCGPREGRRQPARGEALAVAHDRL